MKRAARNMRSGSSPKLTSGAERASATSASPGRPRRRTDRSSTGTPVAGEFERHRVDGEVAPRQIDLDLVGEHDVRLARVVGVRLGAERGDLVDRLAPVSVSRLRAPIVPNLSPCVHIASAQPPRQALISAGRASVVRSRSKSSRSCCTSRSRTDPPTRYRRCPRVAKAASRAGRARPGPARNVRAASQGRLRPGPVRGAVGCGAVQCGAKRSRRTARVPSAPWR